MGQLSSDLESKTQIVESLLDDFARHFQVSVLLDKAYVRNRAESEGSSFFTKALPLMGKVFDEWMRDESRELTFVGFHPNFLIGVRRLIVGTDSGPDRVAAIRSLRQLAYLFYKLETPPSSKQLHDAVVNFKEVDHDLVVQDVPWFDPRFMLARRLISELLVQSEFETLKLGLNPRHGPGSVATGEKGPGKWRFQRLNPLVGQILDYREMYHLTPFSTIGDEDTTRMEKDLVLDPFPTSKLVAVPKDSRGPRLICEEPLEMQYLQQWVFRILDHMIEGSKFRCEITMRDQSRNQILAAEGSITHQWSTIDLKEASDRVSLPLVLSLFPEWLHPWFVALRSVRVSLPDGTLFPTCKFAPMGSALCFPVESIIFWALSRATCILNGYSNRLPCPTVSVFGDDIIVPNEMFGSVCELLEACGLKVNATKSYHRGDFRESCGFDAYQGVNVTPVRIKTGVPSSWRQGREISNYVAVFNGLHERSFDACADKIGSLLYKVAPLLSTNNVGGLCMASGHRGRTRWNSRYQRVEIYTYQVKSRTDPFHEGVYRLRRNLVSPVVEGDPGLYSLPRQTRVEKGWLPFLS